MIKTFADTETEALFADGVCKALPPEVVGRARRKLFSVDAATRVDDLREPPGDKLHRLKGDRAGQYAIRVNDKWRICFTFEGGDAFDVELCDYH